MYLKFYTKFKGISTVKQKEGREEQKQIGGKRGLEEVGWKKVIRERSKEGGQIVLRAAKHSKFRTPAKQNTHTKNKQVPVGPRRNSRPLWLHRTDSNSFVSGSVALGQLWDLSDS